MAPGPHKPVLLLVALLLLQLVATPVCCQGDEAADMEAQLKAAADAAPPNTTPGKEAAIATVPAGCTIELLEGDAKTAALAAAAGDETLSSREPGKLVSCAEFDGDHLGNTDNSKQRDPPKQSDQSADTQNVTQT